MKVKELLKLFDKAIVEDRESGCYKRVYFEIIKPNGEKEYRECSYNNYDEISNNILDLNVVNLEKIRTHNFALSKGIKIYLQVC